jgi:hypothetical protein
MASGAMCRTNRSDTWPHQPVLQRHPKNPCQRRAVDTGSRALGHRANSDRLRRAESGPKRVTSGGAGVRAIAASSLLAQAAVGQRANLQPLGPGGLKRCVAPSETEGLAMSSRRRSFGGDSLQFADLGAGEIANGLSSFGLVQLRRGI